MPLVAPGLDKTSLVKTEVEHLVGPPGAGLQFLGDLLVRHLSHVQAEILTLGDSVEVTILVRNIAVFQGITVHAGVGQRQQIPQARIDAVGDTHIKGLADRLPGLDGIADDDADIAGDPHLFQQPDLFDKILHLDPFFHHRQDIPVAGLQGVTHGRASGLLHPPGRCQPPLIGLFGIAQQIGSDGGAPTELETGVENGVHHPFHLGNGCKTQIIPEIDIIGTIFFHIAFHFRQDIFRTPEAVGIVPEDIMTEGAFVDTAPGGADRHGDLLFLLSFLAKGQLPGRGADISLHLEKIPVHHGKIIDPAGPAPGIADNPAGLVPPGNPLHLRQGAFLPEGVQHRKTSMLALANDHHIGRGVFQKHLVTGPGNRISHHHPGCRMMLLDDLRQPFDPLVMGDNGTVKNHIIAIFTNKILNISIIILIDVNIEQVKLIAVLMDKGHHRGEPHRQDLVRRAFAKTGVDKQQFHFSHDTHLFSIRNQVRSSRG